MKKTLSNIIILTIIFTFAINLTMISTLLEGMRKTYSLGISQSGFIFTVNFTGFVGFVLIGGYFADRHGKKLILIISTFCFSLLLLLVTFSPNFTVLCILMFLIGGFGGIIESMTMAVLSDMNTKNAVFYVNLSQVCFGVGAIAGPILAGYAISSGYGWQACYAALSVVVFIFSIFLCFCNIPKIIILDSFKPISLFGCFRNSRFMHVCLCMLLYTGSEVGGWGWLCTLLNQKLNFSTSKSSLAVAVFWIAMTAGRFLCGALASNINLRTLIITLAFSSSVLTAVSCLITNEAIIWVIIALIGLAYSSQYPFLISFGSRQTTESTSTSFPMLMGFGGIGCMIVPYLMGIIGSAASMNLSMLLPAVLLLLIGVIFVTKEKENAGKAK